MKRPIIAALVVLGTLAATTAANAESPTVSTIIDLTPGDSFEFESQNSFRKVYVGRREDGTEVFNIERGGTALYETIYTKERNLISNNTSVGDPHRGELVSPLFVGRSWDHSYRVVSRGESIQRVRPARVEAYERVKTPAGTFWAFRISSSNQRVGRSRPAQETYWYSPEVGDIIKYESPDLTDGNRVLVKFYRAPKAPTEK